MNDEWRRIHVAQVHGREDGIHVFERHADALAFRNLVNAQAGSITACSMTSQLLLDPDLAQDLMEHEREPMDDIQWTERRVFSNPGGHPSQLEVTGRRGSRLAQEFVHYATDVYPSAQDVENAKKRIREYLTP